MASVKQAWIKKYGEKDGLRKWKELNKGKGTLDWYIKKHGKVDGTFRYYEKNKKLSISTKTLKANGKTDNEIKAIQEKHKNKSKQTLDNMIKRYGEIEGEIKWNDYKQKQKLSSMRTIGYWIKKGYSDIEAKAKLTEYQIRDLSWFVKKYGKEMGKIKYIDCQKRKGKTKGQLVSKFGKQKANEILESRRVTHEKMIKKYGIKKAKAILKSKTTKFHGSSKIQKKFAQELYNILDINTVKSFYGDPFTDSYYIHLTEDEKKILNQKVIIPDILINFKYIIEFDGTYWHSFTKEKDLIKDVIYEQREYEVIRVPEAEYKKNKQKILMEIKERIENEN